MAKEQAAAVAKRTRQVNVDELDIFLIGDLIKLAVHTAESIDIEGDGFPAGSVQGSRRGSLYALLSLICDKYQPIIEAFDPVSGA